MWDSPASRFASLQAVAALQATAGSEVIHRGGGHRAVPTAPDFNRENPELTPALNR